MRRKGFTLVELLVVIAIIALLMGILMPALARVRQLAFRMVCGTNLAGIGKAMLIYANDYEDELPRAGGRNTGWGQLARWDAPSRVAAYGLSGADNSGGKATISSCFYLLVKYAEVTPKSFVCKGDSGTTEFKLAEALGTGTTTLELIDVWDFGTQGVNGTAYKSCSYSYHYPFSQFALTVSSEPGFAVAADRNPWLMSPAGPAGNFAEFRVDLQGHPGTAEQAKKGNAIAHQSEGQNVMFLDTHVDFEKRAYCSIEDDNIYTLATGSLDKGLALGTVPVAPTGATPINRKDSVLVHDPEFGTKGRTCFAAGTPAWVDGRLVPIDQATAGQAVGAVAFDRMAAGGSLRIERVDAHEGVFRDAYTVFLDNGEDLCVVGSHLFLLDGGTWARVENLRAGSILRTHEAPVRVLAVLRHDRPYVGTVYNLKVQDADHYFVGAAGVVVRDY